MVSESGSPCQPSQVFLFVSSDAVSDFSCTSASGSPPLRPENMVHHTMSTSTRSAASASSKIKAI